MSEGEAKKIFRQTSQCKEVIANDIRLQDIIYYELTRGNTIKITNHEESLAKFAEYKALVRRGCFTIDQLEEKALFKFGIVEGNDHKEDEIVFLKNEPKKSYRSTQ